MGIITLTEHVFRDTLVPYCDFMGDTMTVNLDAMIPRADFDSDATSAQSDGGGKELYLTSLTP